MPVDRWTIQQVTQALAPGLDGAQQRLGCTRWDLESLLRHYRLWPKRQLRETLAQLSGTT